MPQLSTVDSISQLPQAGADKSSALQVDAAVASGELALDCSDNIGCPFMEVSAHSSLMLARNLAAWLYQHVLTSCHALFSEFPHGAEHGLCDRSTARVTTGQRVSLNQIETSSRQDREGQMYWMFEHSSQVSKAPH